MEVPTGVEGGFTYNADLYTAETAAAFRERFVEMLRRIAANPALSVAELTSRTDSPSAEYLGRLAAPPAEPVPIPADASVRPDTTTGGRLSDAEFAVAEIWSSLLNVDVDRIRADDRFFLLGGNSLQAMQLVEHTERRFSRKLLLNDLVTDPTIRELAALMGAPVVRDSLALLRPGVGSRPAVFFVHDGDGETLLYRNLAQRLSPEHAVYGLQPHSANGHAMLHTRLSDMAQHHIQKIRRVQPHGPYLLGGLCAGGVIAYEIARQLQQQGESIAMLALIDAADVGVAKRSGRVAGQRLKRFAGSFTGDDGAPSPRLQTWADRMVKAARKVVNLLAYEVSSRFRKSRIDSRIKLLRRHLDHGTLPPARLQSLTVSEIYQFALLDDANSQRLRGDVTLFRATMTGTDDSDEPYTERFADPLLGWQKRITGTVRCFDVPGGHFSMLQEPHVQAMAASMQAFIDQALGDAEAMQIPALAGGQPRSNPAYGRASAVPV